MKYSTIKHIKTHQLSIEKISTIIAESILQEPYLNKEELTIKIKALLKNFRYVTFHQDWHKIPKPNEYQKLLKRAYDKEHQRNFYRTQLRLIIGDEAIEKLDNELNTINI